MDHTLAVLSVLARLGDKRCLILGEEDVVFHAPAGRRLALALARGTRVSLFPMAPVAGRSTGLAWPIAGLEFAPAGRVGTSNAATGPVTLTFDGDGMLVIVPRGCLGAAIAALVPGGPA
jgi:thiamine pyrophosphokinase